MIWTPLRTLALGVLALAAPCGVAWAEQAQAPSAPLGQVVSGPAAPETRLAASLTVLPLQASLPLSRGRAGVGVHWNAETISLWTCLGQCAPGAPTVSLDLPAGVRGQKLRVERLGNAKEGNALWIRVGEASHQYSVLVVGAALTPEGPTPGDISAPASAVSVPVAPKTAATVGIPTVLLKGLTGPDSPSKSELTLSQTSGGAALMLASGVQPGLCGRTIAAKTRLLDLAAGRLKQVQVSPLGATERSRAEGLVATPTAETPDRLLLSLAPPQPGSALAPVDSERSLPWAAGYEYTEVANPQGLAAPALVFEFAEALSAPAHVYLVVDSIALRVEFPVSPERLYSIDKPSTKGAKCLAVVQEQTPALLVEVMGSTESARPVTTDELVRDLEKSDPGLAQAALRLRGAAAGAALAKRFGRMSQMARGRALDVAEGLPRQGGFALYAAAVELGNEVERERGYAQLSASPSAAQGALMGRLKATTPAGEPALLGALARFAPESAVHEIVPRLAVKSPARRERLRALLSELAQTEQGAAALLAVLREAHSEPSKFSSQVQVELVRALGSGRDKFDPDLRLLVEKLAASADFGQSFLLAPEVLPRVLDSVALEQVFGRWLVGEVKGSPTPIEQVALSALAMRLLTDAQDKEISARFRHRVQRQLTSPHMRLRKGALEFLREDTGQAPYEQVRQILAKDEWPELRSLAAAAILSTPRGAAHDEQISRELVRRLKRDEDLDVRRSAARALGALGGEEAILTLRRSFAKDERYEVRAEAALSLGKLCDWGSLGAFTDAATKLSRGPLGEGPTMLGLASVTALAHLTPKDVRGRLKSVLEKESAPVLRNQVLRRIEAVEASRHGLACQKP